MKITAKLFALLFFATITFGCGDDDDPTPPTVNNEFTIQGTDYATPNAYIIMEPNPNPEDAFFLFFTNGSLVLDTSVNSEILMSTNTTNTTVLLVNHGSTVSGQQNINLNSGQSYALNKDNSLSATNITAFTSIATINGNQYGEPNETQATLYEIENSGSGSVTVNTFTVDYVAKTGTIDCTYTMTDDNGVPITGSYSGNFSLIVNNI